MSTISLNVPREILLDLNTNENSFSSYVKKFVALDLYQNRNISLGYCAEFAEMPKEDFIKFLGTNKVSIFGYDDELDFLEEVSNA
jgi:predicted HTH domain antitoxin